MTRFAYDAWKNSNQYLVGNENWDVWADLNGSSSLTTRYLRGDVIDQVFARSDMGAKYWTLTDRLGSVRDVINSGGTVKDTIAYNGFGGITSESDSNFRGRYAWTGREVEAEIDLQYNRARWYDANSGRWISQDPLGFDAGDSNLYRYVRNGPTTSTDPSGNELYWHGWRVTTTYSWWENQKSRDWVEIHGWKPSPANLNQLKYKVRASFSQWQKDVTEWKLYERTAKMTPGAAQTLAQLESDLPAEMNLVSNLTILLNVSAVVGGVMDVGSWFCAVSNPVLAGVLHWGAGGLIILDGFLAKEILEREAAILEMKLRIQRIRDNKNNYEWHYEEKDGSKAPTTSWTNTLVGGFGYSTKQSYSFWDVTLPAFLGGVDINKVSPVLPPIAPALPGNKTTVIELPKTVGGPNR